MSDDTEARRGTTIERAEQWQRRYMALAGGLAPLLAVVRAADRLADALDAERGLWAGQHSHDQWLAVTRRRCAADAELDRAVAQLRALGVELPPP